MPGSEGAYSIGQLRDLIDLTELGGSPVWPDDLNLARAKEILRQSEEQARSVRETASNVAEIREGAACTSRRGVTTHIGAEKLESALPGCVVPTLNTRTSRNVEDANMFANHYESTGTPKNGAGSSSSARLREDISHVVSEDTAMLGAEIQHAMDKKTSRVGERKRQLENKRKREAEVRVRPILEQEEEGMTDAQRRTARLLAKVRRTQV
jgi:hypothetical protein